MAQAESSDLLGCAPQVCLHCKAIKKGCDKKLPRCSQCIKRRAVCRYGDPADTRRSGDHRGQALKVVEGTNSWACLPREVLSTLNPNIRLSVMLMDSLSDVIPFDLEERNKSSGRQTTNLVFHSQICSILRAEGQYIDNIVTNYFAGTHRWLPIISRKRFNDRLVDFQTLPTADFSILVLAMRVITQHPPKAPNVDKDHDVLYLALKTLFTQVRSFIPSSIHLVQAGIIIASYEHAHGMIEAAYDSIGICARMAFAAGLQNIRCSDALQGTDTWYEDEEALCTWWGLVICDRVIGCEPQINGRPLATRCIRENDYLPLESSDLEDRNMDLAKPIFRYFVSSTTLPGVGTFGREAQATYLLDRVLVAVEGDEISDAKWVEIYALDALLQPFLGLVMEQVGGRWGFYCGANSLAITALYILHRKVVAQSEGNGQCSPISRIALTSITRMVIDIAYSFNSESSTFDIDMFSPAVSHIARCAQQHIIMGGELRTNLWHKDLDQLRKMLAYLNCRWSIAGKELRLLNRAVEP